MKRHHNRYMGFLLKAYTQQVQDLYDFEKQLLAILPQLGAEPLNSDSTVMLTEHLRQTEKSIERLEEIMKRLNVHYPIAHSRDTSHWINNLKRLLKEPAHARDLRHEVAILSAMLKVEAFEVACYATTHSYARLLSFHDDLVPLERTYSEQKTMEEKIERLLARLKNVDRRSGFQLSV